jgi:DNA helicase-2/ATP-dependent DNA helicase PcrA
MPVRGWSFRWVYLPGLAQGQFPPNSRNRDEVCPPGFREDDAPGEHEAKERCLFYVGVTRARDVVVLTRALSYDARRMAPPSSLLMLVESASAYQQAPSLLTDEELTSLAARVASQEGVGDEDSGDEGAGMLSSDIQVRHEGIPKRAYTLNELEQYLECPLRYKYARCYGLLDPVRDIVHCFYRYVHRGRRELREIHAAAPDANWAAVEARLRARWAMDGPAEHAYGPFYWQHARDILYREWQMLLAVSASSAPGKPVSAQQLHAELACCIVEVTADRITSELATGSNSSAMLSVDLVRVHTRRPYERDREDLALPLYYLAHTQQYPGVPVRIVLAYIGDVLAGEGPDMDMGVPGNIIDVTDEACKVVEKYIKPGRKQRSRLDKLDEAAAAIEAGRFPPRPQEERCAVCPFYSICPADPEAGEPGGVYD